MAPGDGDWASNYPRHQPASSLQMQGRARAEQLMVIIPPPGDDYRPPARQLPAVASGEPAQAAGRRDNPQEPPPPEDPEEPGRGYQCWDYPRTGERNESEPTAPEAIEPPMETDRGSATYSAERSSLRAMFATTQERRRLRHSSRVLRETEVERILEDQEHMRFTGGVKGSWWHKTMVAADFITPSIPRFVARDFKAFEELEIHHDNLLLDVTLDEGEQREMGRVTKRVRFWGGVLSILSMLVLVFLLGFEIYSIATKEQISSLQIQQWEEGKIQIQPVRVAVPTDYTMTTVQCMVPNGDYSGIQCTDVSSQVTSCDAEKEGDDWPFPPAHMDLSVDAEYYCLPSDLYILGVYGMPEYWYIQMTLSPNDGVAATGESSLWLNDYSQNPLTRTWHSIYMTWPSTITTVTEVFNLKYGYYVYGLDGLGPKYSLDSTARNQQDTASFYRMYSRERHEDLRVSYRYTIIRSIQVLGGLYTGLAFIGALPLVIAFIVRHYCKLGRRTDAFTRDVRLRDARAQDEFNHEVERRAEDPEAGTSSYNMHRSEVLRAATTYVRLDDPMHQLYHQTIPRSHGHVLEPAIPPYGQTKARLHQDEAEAELRATWDSGPESSKPMRRSGFENKFREPDEVSADTSIVAPTRPPAGRGGK